MYDLYDDARIDYLELWFNNDPTYVQGTVMPMLASFQDDLPPEKQSMSKEWNMVVVKRKDGGTGYKLSVWGWLATSVAHNMPPAWLKRLRRADMRYKTIYLDVERIRGLQAYLVMHPIKRLQVLTFNTPVSMKTDQRDVGGFGVRLGSRKSDQHIAIYKRGVEPIAIEFRLRGRKLAELCEAEYQHSLMGDASKVRFNLRNAMECALAERWQTLFGTDNYQGAPAQWEQMGAQLTMLEEAFDVSEFTQAEEWFAGLSEEEQAEWQDDTFEPTPKGLHEPGNHEQGNKA